MIEEWENSKLTADELWEKLKKYDQAHDIIQCGSNGDDDSYTSDSGIVLGHAYSVIGVVELSTGDRLIKLRNPHGSDSYHGDWSDESSKWTDALRAEAGAENNKRDGIIFLTVEDYRKEFGASMVNKDMSNVHQDYFLMLGDDGSLAMEGEKFIETNTLHKLTITSEVD